MARRAQRVVDERGVTMVIFGLMIVALLIIVAIVIDLGNARQQKRQLQNAADAAALAGASDINVTNGNPCSQAVTYAYNNLSLGTPTNTTCTQTTKNNMTITVSAPYYSGPAAFSANSLVNVQACQNVGTYFAKIIGISTIHVCGNATARKIGVTQSNCTGGGCGTTTADPNAPCTVDAFTTNGYYDDNSKLRNNPKNDASGLNLNNQGMNAAADNNHTGGAPGGVIKEGDWVGATYWSTTPIDFTTNVPTLVFTNTTTGSSTTYTDTAGYGIAATGGPIYIKPMSSVFGQPAFATPPTYVYDIVWKVPAGNPNNAAYSVALTVYDSASSSNPPNGKCGKALWNFTKGTPPSSGGTSCGENSFIGTISPAPGAVVHPGDTLTVAYEDESPLYNPGDASGDANRIQFTVDNVAIPQAPLGTPSTQGPNSQSSSYGSTTNYTLKSPTSGSTSEKYSTDIQFKVPSSLTSGSHTWFLKAYDSDNNKPGGDCGVATWTLNVAGGASNVELVQ
jgi:Flp pilus assembly protein TadG